MKKYGNMYILEIPANNGITCPVLFTGEEETLLIDTGFPAQAQLLAEAIQQAGTDLQNVTQLWFTHQDLDHIGCVNEVKQAAPQVEIGAYKDEVPFIQGDAQPVKVAKLLQDYDAMNAESQAFARSFKQAFEDRRTRVDLMFADGDVLPLYGGLEIIHTPGHTPGHMCVYVRQEKTLIAGDALFLRDGVLSVNKEHAQDVRLAYRSVKRLMDYDIQRIVCYHGGVFEDGAAGALAWLIKE